MANFSTDQVRQLYIPLSYKNAPLVPTDPVGTMNIRYTTEDIWLTYVTPNGDVTVNGTTSIVRSDIIPIKNVTKAVSAPARRRNLKRQQIVLDPAINAGAPVVGQEYILRFTFYGLGIGGPENQYIKNGGAYRVKPGDTVATVLENLAALARLNFSREPYPYVKVTTDAYDPYTMAAMPGTSTYIQVEEVIQPWVRGKRQAAPINFEVHCVRILWNGFEWPWGLVTDTTSTNPNYQGNGRMIADMEYFYLGERADQFRGMGYPDNFESIYIADPTREYETFDIEYFYAGDKEDANPRSKKYISIACDPVMLSMNTIRNLFSVAGVNVEVRP